MIHDGAATSACRRPLLGCLAAALGMAAIPAHAVENPGLRRFLHSAVALTDGQIAAIEAGQVVTKQLPTTDKPEAAAFGAIRLRTDKAGFLRKLRDLESFRKGPLVLEIGDFGRHPKVEDLAALTLDDGDFEAAKQCRPGRCDIKLAVSAMERIHREIDWKARDAKARASALMKRMLVEYADAYMRGGTAAMAVYHDKETPLATLAEFRKVLSASPYLVEYVPEFHRYLEEYPKGALAGAEDLFYWAKDKFCPKPTIALYHVTLWQDPKNPGLAIVSSKQIYASHYFRAGLELNALVDAPGGGFHLMSLYRARIDPPSGMLSGVVLGRIRSGIEQGLAENLRAAKARVDGR